MSEITAAEAAQMVEADKQRRVRAAAEAIASVLREHNCDLVAAPQIVDGRIVAIVQIVGR